MDRRIFFNLDWLLLGLVLILEIISLTTLYSLDQFFFKRQLIWAIGSLIVILAAIQIDWGKLVAQKTFRTALYLASLALLIVPFVQGKVIRSTYSWLVVGGFQFEVSELVKLAIIIVLASFFSKKHLAVWQRKTLIQSLILVLVPVLIIMKQPDFGSALVIGAIWVSFILMSDLNKKKLFTGLLLVAGGLIIAWLFVLAPYQKARIQALFSPNIDPLGINYNVAQSKIAIGSAGWLGKGFGNGTQAHLGFLPEARTDFLFASFVEEWGVIGGLILILTYLALIIKLGLISLRLKRNDLKFVVLGTASVLLIQFLINVGTNLGLVPVIGIGLPFVSYGGSNLLTFSILIGIIEKIRLES